MSGATSDTHGNLRDRIVGYRADRALDGERVSARIAAYVYGNIIVFASVIPLTTRSVEEGHAPLIVLGAALTTFLAHVFAELVGSSTRHGEHTATAVRHELRDASPIATSALVPALLLTASFADWIPPSTAIIASDIYLLIRIALTGMTVERLRSTRTSLLTFLSGLPLALIAATISLLKATLGH